MKKIKLQKYTSCGGITLLWHHKEESYSKNINVSNMLLQQTSIIPQVRRQDSASKSRSRFFFFFFLIARGGGGGWGIEIAVFEGAYMCQCICM